MRSFKLGSMVWGCAFALTLACNSTPSDTSEGTETGDGDGDPTGDGDGDPTGDGDGDGDPTGDGDGDGDPTGDGDGDPTGDGDGDGDPTGDGDGDPTGDGDGDPTGDGDGDPTGDGDGDPTGDGDGDNLSCEEIEATYNGLVEGADATACTEDEQCQILDGHCWMGIGGCWYVVNDTVDQSQLDALAQQFGGQGCFGPICSCIAPPAAVVCVDNICQPA